MVKRTPIVLLALAFVTAPLQARDGSEAISVDAEKAFFEAVFSRPVSDSLSLERAASLAATEVASLDLAALLNRQFKSSLKYRLGGKDVWVGGTFDREQAPYISILVDGSEVVIFKMMSLVRETQVVQAGTNKYKLYIEPNYAEPKKSLIVLENSANAKDKTLITLEKMISALASAGDTAVVEEQTYKVFYTDDVKDGQIDKTVKNFGFLLTEKTGEFHVFLFPAECVGSSRIVVFKMFQNKRVGLLQKDGRLKVYSNPPNPKGGPAAPSCPVE